MSQFGPKSPYQRPPCGRFRSGSNEGSTAFVQWVRDEECRGRRLFFLFFFGGEESTTVLSHWISPMGKIGLFYQGKASCDRVALPNLRCIPGVLVYLIHRTLTWATGSITCTQMSVHAITHGGLRTHVRESALNGDWEKNPLPHRGIEPA